MKTETEDLLRGLPTEKLEMEREDALAAAGSETDRETIVLHNMREAFFYARHVCHGKLPEDEIYSAVYGALAHAVRNYRPGTKVGVRFFAYAKPYIRGALCKEWKAKNVVKHADHETLSAPEEQLNDTHDCAWEDRDGMSILSKWETQENQEPAFDEIHLREQLEVIRPILKSHLSEHERMIIELTYSGQHNFEELSKLLGVTRSAVQNSHTRAIRKVRAALRRKQRLL